MYPVCCTCVPVQPRGLFQGVTMIYLGVCTLVEVRSLLLSLFFVALAPRPSASSAAAGCVRRLPLCCAICVSFHRWHPLTFSTLWFHFVRWRASAWVSRGRCRFAPPALIAPILAVGPLSAATSRIARCFRKLPCEPPRLCAVRCFVLLADPVWLPSLAATHSRGQSRTPSLFSRNHAGSAAGAVGRVPRVHVDLGRMRRPGLRRPLCVLVCFVACLVACGGLRLC